MSSRVGPRKGARDHLRPATYCRQHRAQCGERSASPVSPVDVISARQNACEARWHGFSNRPKRVGVETSREQRPARAQTTRHGVGRGSRRPAQENLTQHRHHRRRLRTSRESSALGQFFVDKIRDARARAGASAFIVRVPSAPRRVCVASAREPFRKGSCVRNRVTARMRRTKISGV